METISFLRVSTFYEVLQEHTLKDSDLADGSKIKVPLQIQV